jgi:replicative DNA helicase
MLDKPEPEPFDPSYVVPAEQALIGHCMIKPHEIGEIAAALDINAVSEPFHKRALEILFELHASGRTPSLESLIAVTGNDELAPMVTVRDYMRRIMSEAIIGGSAPWRDAVEVIHDGNSREELLAIGSLLSAASSTAKVAIPDIVSNAVARLDDVAARATGKCNTYDAQEAADMALAHLDSEGGRWPTTGLDDLDRMLGGWPIGQLSILAARPSMGKSAAATSAVLSAVRKGHATMFFSLEMVGIQIGARILTDLAYTTPNPVQYEDIIKSGERGRATIGDMGRRRINAARELLAKLPIKIDEQRGLSMADIVARSRKHANELARYGEKLELIVVDHIGLVKPSSRYAGNRVREVAEISDGLATLAKDLDCAVVGLCQLNRAVEGRENRRPTLSDLRDSGAIEEDAATVTFLYRHAYYLERLREDDTEKEKVRQELLTACQHDIEYSVAKNRNGRCGLVDAWVDIGANAIRDKANRR